MIRMKSMSSSGYEINVRRRLLVVLLLLSVAASIFYLLQNSSAFVGGKIALPKLIWLMYVILFWYCLPLLIVFDKRVSRPFHQAFMVIFINMMARAIIELWMIYFTLSWHPYYGIAHDVFSIFLIAILIVVLQRKSYLDIVLSKYLLVISSMFILECVFASYLLNNMWQSKEMIYFVPAGNEHALILNSTWAVVFMLTVYLVMFSRRWLSGPITSRDS
ncbi:MAG: hypothetical protein QNL62_11840 [Gammaproteobacteria bacterium]|nr:hypothetical protein [Gammaproteobacteria bacterium]